MTLARYIYALTLLPLLAGLPHEVLAANHHNLGALIDNVNKHLQNLYGEHSEKVEISVSPLDKRLRLAACPTPVLFDVRDLTGDGGAVRVLARCEGPSPWKIYLGAQVEIYRQILVTRSGMNRHQKVEARDISSVLMSTSSLRSGYFTDPQRVIGKQLRRPVDAGEPLRSGLLEEPIAINRGEVITLESNSGAISVATQAEALSSGRIGEQIRVRNLGSERIVRGHIVADGRVTANF
ncbi:flagellar basal body P-ring formation chaperone FlgA [Gilvimarinus chinensis]|uniref:flagellar basal body P-ring formation chaperone FlgA n=1 Tax=Gilvimarinus chinensis TaxID=396005 RepID=UPI000364D26F|nr:flagellar basal body P-ring formation chaperone FlgA [Gilvimarinus chinensis]